VARSRYFGIDFWKDLFLDHLGSDLWKPLATTCLDQLHELSLCAVLYVSALKTHLRCAFRIACFAKLCMVYLNDRLALTVAVGLAC
jgi:hypothetical protein